MIEEFEKCLAEGGDLENCRTVLLRNAENDRTRRLEAIERDYKLAQLIRYGLEQPRDSAAYSIAKGFQRWYQKQYPVDDSIVRALRKSIWEDERTVAKSGNKNGKGGNLASAQRIIDGGSASDEAILSTPIPEIEP